MFELTVREVEFLAPDIFELGLERGRYPFEAGECAVLFNEAGDSRPYSFSSGPKDELLRFLVRRIPGGAVSDWLAKRQPGDTILVSTSFGDFRFGDDERSSVFVATGVGISPFLSVLRHAPPPVRPLCFYGIRYLIDAVHLDLLGRHTDLRLAVSREAVDGAHHGRVTDLLEQIPIDDRTSYYLCGQDAMAGTVWDHLLARGVSRDHVHAEVFFGIS